MLECARGIKTHRLSGEHVQAIGRSLFYKRIGLLRGGNGEGEHNGYDARRYAAP